MSKLEYWATLRQLRRAYIGRKTQFKIAAENARRLRIAEIARKTRPVLG